MRHQRRGRSVGRCATKDSCLCVVVCCSATVARSFSSCGCARFQYCPLHVGRISQRVRAGAVLAAPRGCGGRSAASSVEPAGLTPQSDSEPVDQRLLVRCPAQPRTGRRQRTCGHRQRGCWSLPAQGCDLDTPPLHPGRRTGSRPEWRLLPCPRLGPPSPSHPAGRTPPSPPKTRCTRQASVRVV